MAGKAKIMISAVPCSQALNLPDHRAAKTKPLVAVIERRAPATNSRRTINNTGSQGAKPAPKITLPWSSQPTAKTSGLSA